MARRWLLLSFSLVAAAAVSGCASGDGPPTALIENGLTDICIVEASYLNYGFTDPIGPSGVTGSREVTVGSDVVYAVAMRPGPGQTCYDTALTRGGDLYVTNDAYQAEPGKLTRITIDDTTAHKIPVDCSIDYVEGLKRFSRLFNACDSDAGPPPQDAAPDAPTTD